MKKTLFLLANLLIINQLCFGQSVTIVPTNPASPTKGTIDFNNGTNQLQYWNSAAWIPITNAASGTGWALSGNDIFSSNTGKIGIGTTTPLHKLSVVTPTFTYGLTHSDGNLTMGSWLTATTGQFGTKSNHPLEFFTNNGSAQMTILPNGNVGIGTTSPTALLNVKGSVLSDGISAGLRFNDRTNNTKGYQWYSSGGNAYLYRHQLSMDAISVLESGNIGFNTSTPQSDLHINPNGAGGILIGTDNIAQGFTTLEMGISALNNGYSFIQSKQSTGVSYGNLYLNPYGGNVGINTTLATYPLDIVQLGEGYYDSDAKALRIRSTWLGSNYNWALHGAGNFIFSVNGVTKAFIDRFDGSYNPTSDLRFKKDINKMDNVLNRVISLDAKTYHYKEQQSNDKLCLGFIAQEVLPLFPELVNNIGGKDSTDSSVHYGINYAGFSVIAIKAIQEQQNIIDSQNKKIDLLIIQNKIIMGEIEKLKQK